MPHDIKIGDFAKISFQPEWEGEVISLFHNDIGDYMALLYILEGFNVEGLDEEGNTKPQLFFSYLPVLVNWLEKKDF